VHTIVASHNADRAAGPLDRRRSPGLEHLPALQAREIDRMVALAALSRHNRLRSKSCGKFAIGQHLRWELRAADVGHHAGVGEAKTRCDAEATTYRKWVALRGGPSPRELIIAVLRCWHWASKVAGCLRMPCPRGSHLARRCSDKRLHFLPIARGLAATVECTDCSGGTYGVNPNL
jgi:hypothetical protein